jgi:hypothetical protein
MTNFTQQIQDCYENNSSWAGDLNNALFLYTVGGDWKAQVDWIEDYLVEENGAETEEAEEALEAWVTQNAVENFFADVPCYMPCYDMDSDERNQLLLQHAITQGCSWKAWTFLLSEDTDWLYYGDTGMDVETTLKRANLMVAQAKEDSTDEMDVELLNEFIEQYTEENA